MLSLALALAISAGDIQTAIGIDPAMCRLVRIAANGARTETPPSRHYRRPSSSSVNVRSSGGQSSSSSVSVSTRSTEKGGGSGQSRAQVDGQTIIATYNPTGCDVVVDARAAPEH